MKRLLIFAMLLAAQIAASAADTAYTALRAFGKKEGEKSLHRVIELRGRNGAPQPTAWRIVVDAPEARGGIREVDIQNGKIVGQRTPVSRDVGGAMNFNQLNLDSDGAFTVINQETQRRRVPFDRLDYTLRSGSGGGAPVWHIEIFEKGAKAGTMRIAADTGEVLEQNFSAPPRYAEDRRYLDNGRRTPVAPEYPPMDAREDEGPRVYDADPEEDYREERRGSGLPGFIDRVGRHFQRRGRQLENFFTGRESRDYRDSRDR